PDPRRPRRDDRAPVRKSRRRGRGLRAGGDDLPRPRRARARRGTHRRGRGQMITVELEGLEVFGRHGAEEEERREGGTFLYDVQLEVADNALSDRIEDAVDYRKVAACVREVSDGRQFHLLEALAAAVADAIVDRFPVERV